MCIWRHRQAFESLQSPRIVASHTGNSEFGKDVSVAIFIAEPLPALFSTGKYDCYGFGWHIGMFGINGIENGKLVDLEGLKMVSQLEFTNN